MKNYYLLNLGGRIIIDLIFRLYNRKYINMRIKIICLYNIFKYIIYIYNHANNIYSIYIIRLIFQNYKTIANIYIKLNHTVISNIWPGFVSTGTCIDTLFPPGNSTIIVDPGKVSGGSGTRYTIGGGTYDISDCLKLNF